jgi:hypothetical protein
MTGTTQRWKLEPSIGGDSGFDARSISGLQVNLFRADATIGLLTAGDADHAALIDVLTVTATVCRRSVRVDGDSVDDKGQGRTCSGE